MRQPTDSGNKEEKQPQAPLKPRFYFIKCAGVPARAWLWFGGGEVGSVRTGMVFISAFSVFCVPPGQCGKSRRHSDRQDRCAWAVRSFLCKTSPAPDWKSCLAAAEWPWRAGRGATSRAHPLPSIPTWDKEGGPQGITEFCHSKDKEKRLFCESNPYVGQYEFKTSRLRTKNRVVLLEENLPI